MSNLMMTALEENELSLVNGGTDANDLIKSVTVYWEDQNGTPYSYTVENRKREKRTIPVTFTVEWEDQGGNHYSQTSRGTL